MFSQILISCSELAWNCWSPAGLWLALASPFFSTKLPSSPQNPSFPPSTPLLHKVPSTKLPLLHQAPLFSTKLPSSPQSSLHQAPLFSTRLPSTPQSSLHQAPIFSTKLPSSPQSSHHQAPLFSTKLPSSSQSSLHQANLFSTRLPSSPPRLPASPRSVCGHSGREARHWTAPLGCGPCSKLL